MNISSRVREINESVTLKLNAKAVELAEQGVQVYNLTAGQLPFRPISEFVSSIRDELDFLKSYQYSPVAGFPELRKKLMNHIEKSRNISFEGLDFDCIISNGGKHSITNVLGSLVDPGDEVMIMAPYWVSYPEIIKFCRGVPIVVESSIFDAYLPSMDDIRKKISPRTKVIIINSPNNPAGISYSAVWMRDFGQLMKENAHITILSDEIYFELSYYDPKPVYHYQEFPELLARTVIVHGISKTLASTGLRIGYSIGPKKLVTAMAKLQGQTTSGASSLIQRALENFDFDLVEKYLEPIIKHLRENSEVVREKLRDAQLGNSWYQSESAFYYLLDFAKTPKFESLKSAHPNETEFSALVCEEILEQFGVALVPGDSFGIPNSARLSLVSPKDHFEEAMNRIVKYFKNIAP